MLYIFVSLCSFKFLFGVWLTYCCYLRLGLFGYGCLFALRIALCVYGRVVVWVGVTGVCCRFPVCFCIVGAWWFVWWELWL